MISEEIGKFGALMILVLCIGVASMFEGALISSLLSVNELLGLAFLAFLSIYAVARIRRVFP